MKREVLDRAWKDRQLMKVITKSQLGFMGHVSRMQSFTNSCITGKLDGIQSGRKQTTTQLDSICSRMQTTVLPSELLK